MTKTGSCLCGKTTYRVDSLNKDIVWCHCTMCRRASGTAAVPWMTVSRNECHWTGDAPQKFQSSDHGTRYFCGTCGSPLAFCTTKHPDDLDLTVSTLQNPEQFAPVRHVWTSTRLPWWPADDLPAKIEIPEQSG
ncbi:MAG TPA: GFA family protein [Deltaproteobacteria bacterium]|nr:GFA family protein [Candidatus Lambdaproteobacteria bacterium]HIL16839.1 GFA family protein [Deltaproteobacteria bacterium]